MNEKALNLSNFFMFMYFENSHRPKIAAWCWKQYQKYLKEVNKK